jgi:hypothetical protein
VRDQVYEFDVAGLDDQPGFFARRTEDVRSSVTAVPRGLFGI